MKQGIKTVKKLYDELERQRSARQDILASTKSIKFNSDSRGSIVSVDAGDKLLPFAVSDLAHAQIADRLNIPKKYYDRMRAENPALLDANVNAWLINEPETRMLRTLDGRLRAFLSNRYRRLDNLELLDHVLPVIAQMKGCEIISCDVTETHLYLKAQSFLHISSLVSF